LPIAHADRDITERSPLFKIILKTPRLPFGNFRQRRFSPDKLVTLFYLINDKRVKGSARKNIFQERLYVL
jgi:hypothetical protein